MNSKKLILPALAFLVIGSAFTGLTQVHAQSSGITFSGLASMISQKFGVDQNQVQTVLDQYRSTKMSEMQEKMQQHQIEKLDQLVKDGKITPAQKQAILAEIAKLKTEVKPESFKDMTPEQRKAEMKKRQDEINSWAKSQGIDLSVLPGILGMRFEGMGHFKRMK